MSTLEPPSGFRVLDHGERRSSRNTPACTANSLQPSLQYLAGSLPVHKGMVLPLLASHNTIRLSFDLEEGEIGLEEGEIVLCIIYHSHTYRV